MIIYMGRSIEEYDKFYRVLYEKIDNKTNTLFKIYEDFENLNDAFDYIDMKIIIDEWESQNET